MYLQVLEAKLEGSGLGFNLSFVKQGKLIEQALPALMYADDIVLMADNKEDLQRLMDICGNEGDRLGFRFSKEKSTVMIFNDIEDCELRIQEVTLEITDKYKYLGVWISNGTEYLREHEIYVNTKGNRNAAVMKNRALWNYNRYDVARGLWKGVMVPGLTFGNAVLCMRSEVQARLQIEQRGIGRLALGAHGNTPNRGVQGDMGWTSFEGRKASSKIKFRKRLREAGEECWARKVFSYWYMKNVDTKWRKRTRKMTGKYLANSRGPNQRNYRLRRR
uniref:Putative tick transposon n=1 Tax=Rhipicephalus microplus TaxID=6941 RepID=A0A6G5AAH8_RHIMP